MTKRIAIGALGGSGTRAVAEVLIQAGVYLGDYLNGANDNLVFTRLFRNPSWYRDGYNKVTFEKRLKLFEKYMRGDSLLFQEKLVLFRSGLSQFGLRNNLKFLYYIFWSHRSVVPARKDWGWKEPNTAIYILALKDYFKNLKYIHVVRHGLDMAFSDNVLQLKNWGWMYNIHIEKTDNEDDIARKQLDYWISSTKEILSHKDDNVFLLNHTRFGENPEEEISNMLDFLNIEVSDELYDQLIRIPKIPSSSGRYLKRDLSIFSPQQLMEIENLGFNI